MLKLFPYELHKIFTKKLFIGILICLLTTNIFLLWYTNQPDDKRAPLESYRLLAKKLDGLSNEQKLVYIKEYYDTTKGIALVESVQSYEAWQNEQGEQLAENLKNQDPDAYNKYYEMWKVGNYLQFTQNIQQEKVFAEEIYQEMVTLSRYDVFLADIQSKSEILSGISIFSKDISDGFSSRNIQKTAQDYGCMKDTTISYDISYGVVSATSFLITDCLAFLFMFVFSFIMMFEEKSRNLYTFIKATPLGRTRTITAKVAVLAVYTAAITLLLFGSNLLFFHFLTGLGDLNRSIQSIGIFMGSVINLSVGQFLICFLLMKWLACFLIGLLVLFSSALFERLPSAFGLCVALLLGSFVLYTFIPNNSKITMLKHVNLFGLFRVQDMLGFYLNLNVLGHPISLFRLRLCVMLFMIVSLLVLVILVFVKSYRVYEPALQIKIVKEYIPTIGKSVFRNELYKVLWMNKVALLLVVFIFIQVYSMVNTTIYLSPNEMLYQSYMKRLVGPLTLEKIDFIEEERLRLIEAQKQLDDLDESLAEGIITEIQALEERQRLERELCKVQEFERVWARYLYLQETPNAQFVYEGGYHQLLGISATMPNMEFPTICIMIILCCYTLFSTEYAAGVSQLLKSTPLGRSYLSKRKLIICTIFTLIITVFGLLPNFVMTAKTYGFPGLFAPINSLEAFQHMPSNLSIGMFLLFCFLLKLVACMTVMLMVLSISKAIRNNVYALLLCTLTIALPMIFYAMGLKWAEYISLVPLFNVGTMFANEQTLQVLIYSNVALIISCFCICFSVKQSSLRL